MWENRQQKDKNTEKPPLKFLRCKKASRNVEILSETAKNVEKAQNIFKSLKNY